MNRSIDSALKYAILITGIVIPWAVGIGVKIHLDALGEPTWDWLYFLHPGRLLAEVWATFWFAAPSLALVILAHFLLSGRITRLNFLSANERRAVILTSAIWGGIGSVPIFIEVFRELDPIVFFVPFFITAIYVGHYLLGLIAGAVLALGSYGIRRMRASS